MIKKILSLTFAILMAVSIVSCGAEEKTAYELVTEGQEKVQTLDSLDYDLDLDMGIGVLGITYNLPVTAKISISGAQSETPEMYITAGFEYMGVTVTLDAYYDSEYVIFPEWVCKTNSTSQKLLQKLRKKLIPQKSPISQMSTTKSLKQRLQKQR